jgi:uracil-DNA glycosylase family protein
VSHREAGERTPEVLIPPDPTVQALQEAARSCQGCGLWRDATQTVFGEGTQRASVMLVGEQPGDREDIEGRPFVGPAGKLLDRALEEAGIDRKKVYVTNVVKHFKWTPKGKRRLHKRPNAEEISACMPWLEAEIAVVQPKILVCLGATAAQALLGKSFRVSQQHGELMEGPGYKIMATMHPSSILRLQDEQDRELQTRDLVDDLTAAANVLNH